MPALAPEEILAPVPLETHLFFLLHYCSTARGSLRSLRAASTTIPCWEEGYFRDLWKFLIPCFLFFILPFSSLTPKTLV